jgi:hypothetical protein
MYVPSFKRRSEHEVASATMRWRGCRRSYGEADRLMTVCLESRKSTASLEGRPMTWWTSVVLAAGIVVSLNVLLLVWMVLRSRAATRLLAAYDREHRRGA